MFIFFFAIIVKFLVWLITRLAILATSVVMKICEIFLRSLLLEYKRGTIVISKLSYRELRATTSVMLSQIVQYSITADWRYCISCLTFVKMVVNFFLYLSNFAI